MRALFVMDPPSTLNYAGDSTYAMMLECQRRGHGLAWCGLRDLTVRSNRAHGWIRPVTVHDTAVHIREEPARWEELADYDVVWMRKDPPFDMDYVFGTYVLDLAAQRTTVLNDPVSLKAANEKMYALQFPEFCPETRVTNRVQDIVDFARQQAPRRIVVKPWDGNGGRGVLVTHGADRNLRAIAEIQTADGRQWAIAQVYLDAIETVGDKRIILVHGEPRGWFLRVPGAEDHRGNMHAGASVRACELTPRDREICAALAPRLRAEGLVFVGIDVIGDHLTEVNVTSPTGIWEVRRLMGRDLAAELCDVTGARVAARAAR